MTEPAVKLLTCRACSEQVTQWQARCPACKRWADWRRDGDGEHPTGIEIKAPSPIRIVPPISSQHVETSLETSIEPTLIRPISTTEHPQPIRITEAEIKIPPRISMGLVSLDRVLGGGLVVGSVILVGGEPGAGKSTLIISALAQASKIAGRRVLYVTGEESESQVTMRAQRVGAIHDQLWLVADTDVDRILAHVRALEPAVVVIDSIQTMTSEFYAGAPGSLAQVRGCAGEIAAYAKSTGTTIVLVGHVTKDGGLAGPKTLEHLVDVTLQLELGEFEAGRFRYLRTFKNRYGSTQETGAFEMTQAGMLDTDEKAARDDDRREADKLADQEQTTIRQLRRALQAALGTWCPRDPGGDGADGETYRLALDALEASNEGNQP